MEAEEDCCGGGGGSWVGLRFWPSGSCGVEGATVAFVRVVVLDRGVRRGT